ncbi:TRAP transporter small permease [Castellaniella sp.]|uniref:TRAP transporter small permease n=1 Tax=Castellaniella sp. TaxID=1955812 RepID=UPI002AFF0BE9|nr:TRAP transporter small permease [Castellaniella sp.]
MNPNAEKKGPAWLQQIRKVEHSLYGLEKSVCVVSLIVMVASTGYSVLIRNLHIAVPNYGELGLAALIPLTLVGGAMCTYMGSHIAVEIVQTAKSRLLRHLAEVAAAVCSLVFAVLYFYSGVVLVEEFRDTGDKLLDLGTPLWWLALCFPIGMGLMGFHCVTRILCVFFGCSQSEEHRSPA